MYLHHQFPIIACADRIRRMTESDPKLLPAFGLAIQGQRLAQLHQQRLVVGRSPWNRRTPQEPPPAAA